MNATIAYLTEAMMDAAARIDSDEKSIELSRVANRLAHQGAVCEAPLTRDEVRLIETFMKENAHALEAARTAQGDRDRSRSSRRSQGL